MTDAAHSAASTSRVRRAAPAQLLRRTPFPSVTAAAAVVGMICSADDPFLVSTDNDARGVWPRGQVDSAVQDLDGHAVEYLAFGTLSMIP